MKIAAVVVLYFPRYEVWTNIQSYLDQVDVLYVVDNSGENDSEIYQQLNGHPKIKMLYHGANQGMGRALNRACYAACLAGFEWLLCMDQDSCFLAGDMQSYVRQVVRLSYQDASIALYTPYHSIVDDELAPTGAYQQIKTCMTSGNLLNLACFSRVGDFRTDFFMDYIDHEYCLRLAKYGYKIMQVNTIKLRHQLGNFKRYNVLGKSISVSNHSALRRYYITRNRIVLIKKYIFSQPKFCTIELINIFIMDAWRILFFEQGRAKKMKYMLRGVWDGVIGNLGYKTYIK